jgi:hypothetical protein
MAAREVDGRREQQRERVSVGCVMRDGAGAGGSGSEAARALEGDGDCGLGCEGVDGVKQGASMAAREAEGEDEDEAMAVDENVSLQRAEGGGGSTGGIKKKKVKRRAKGTKSQQQRQDGKRPGGAREA